MVHNLQILTQIITIFNCTLTHQFWPPVLFWTNLERIWFECRS